jgi:C4-dicarboxylate-specific signal transduction histidine kinase
MTEKSKILIVDDKVANLVALERLLHSEDLGVEVVRANSGNEALALTLENDFALALVDVQMPNMDGYETVELMRDDEKTKHLPVIFVSAVYSGEFHKVRGVEVGAVDFIEKPVVPPILLGKVRIFLDLYHSRIQLEEAHDKLEDKVLERTFELEQAQKELAQAHEELKDATVGMIQNEKLTAMGDMSSAVAHELNQPLNIIKITSQGLLRDLAKERFDLEMLPEDLQDIVGQTERMAEIVDHMGVYSRRPGADEDQETDVNQAADDVFNFVGHQLRVHNIEVKKELSANLPDVLADQISLEQVLLNLIANARYALEETKGDNMYIKVKTSVNAAGKVVLAISDNGGGVPQDIRDKVFAPFFTTKESGKGIGLGLNICKKIVEEVGGQLDLEVEDGQGSTFSISLPPIKGNGK